MSTRKRALFIDRDGTLVKEPPVDYQLDSLEKLEFVPKVMRNLYFIRERLDFEFVMVSNQDGLGTPSFPEETFWPAHNLMLKTLEGEGIVFDDILIDPSFPEDNSPNRKPRTGMLTKYMTGEYDLENSFVIGDRLTDMELAHNLGAKGIWLRPEEERRVSWRLTLPHCLPPISRMIGIRSPSICLPASVVRSYGVPRRRRTSMWTGIWMEPERHRSLPGLVSSIICWIRSVSIPVRI